MFGHNDDATNDDANEPQHDAVLSGESTTVHPDTDHADTPSDTGSPAFTTASPAAASDSVDDKTSDDKHPVTDAAAKGPSDTLDTGEHGDLLNIKQSALKQLSPLVDHLDQTPEEKFRTTMMMIQASDDQTLLKDAYDAAQKITDEKTKAQALLDIVNEINYFTHQS